ncbi:NERD domain-containing protein [Kocuria sp. M1R5S2]|uniref:nuclease-related domain-containing DEAD/DEAH box helicase n=1 Tax=Kocuria rhizosphaerae TaxID=3376285 RepID=UPI00379BDA4E
MPQTFPESPDFPHGSGAERAVWEALHEQLPDDAVLVSGQRITGDDVEAELDLLVLWPGVGNAVIEVKGGRVSLRDGCWRQSGRDGEHRLHRSPLEQARTGMHALLDYLNPRLSRGAGRTTFCAALPYTRLPRDWDVPDAPRDRLFDAGDLAGIAGRLNQLLRRSTRAHEPPDEATVQYIVKNLRRTHLSRQHVQDLARELEDSGNLLTREQERTLSLLRHQRRAQIIGGAGSGKTHLAMLKARQMTRDGHRVALVCYSRGLARYFQLMSRSWPAAERPAYTGLFHRLPVEWGAETGQDDDADHWERRLPLRLGELAAERAPADRFDAIVVDEAQDFGDLWWEALVQCFEDPAEGVLFVFTDEHQRIFDRDGHAPIDLSPFPLDDNLRNTATIAEAFAPLAREPQQCRNAEGPAVRFVDVDPEAVLDAADDAVVALQEEGWDPGRIALLTTGRRHPVQKEIVESEGHDAYWDGHFTAQDVLYGHVLGFKGLERSVVVLAVNGFQDPARARRMVYVGMSRARSLLVVVAPREVLAEAAGPELLAALDAGQSWSPPPG